jgi:2-keto-4-pentenoate hydratase
VTTNASNVAAELVKLRAHGGIIPAGLLAPCDSVDRGFAIQSRAMKLSGARIAGWKVALLSDGVVLSAPIFASDVFASDAVLPIEGRMVDGVECELAFRIDRALPACPAVGYCAGDITPCIGGVMAAFELLQSRLADGFQSPRPHLLADNLGNGGVVLGAARSDWRASDLAEVGIELRVNNAVILSKQGGNPVGDPFRAVVALANHLAERGLSLEPGQVVMTGSYTGVHHPGPDERIEVRFDRFAPVRLRVAGAEKPSSIKTGESLHAGG